jgi:hypothetical protein
MKMYLRGETSRELAAYCKSLHWKLIFVIEYGVSVMADVGLRLITVTGNEKMTLRRNLG